jgi:uncharacterized membrane protein
MRYHKRLQRDLPQWVAAGWVSEDGRTAILRHVESSKGGIGLYGVLAILGATLLGFAAMTFVASNWQEMSKLLRLSLLMLALWGAYATAAVLFSRNLEAFGHAAVLTGVGIFGASIMLVAQMYHMEGNPPDAVLLWGAGSLLAGVVFRSNPALALAMALAVLWSSWESSINGTVHWAFLVAWAAVVAGFFWTSWGAGLQLAVLGLVYFLGSLVVCYPSANIDAFVALGCIGIGFAAAWCETQGARHANPLVARYVPLAPTVFTDAVGLGFLALLSVQFLGGGLFGHSRGLALPGLLLTAILTLGLLIAAVGWSIRTDNKTALRVCYAAFSIEILALYFRTFGTLLNTSLFFLVAGLLVIGLAAAAYKLNARAVALIKS